MSRPQSNVWMRSRRFWLLAAAILLLNNVAWFAYLNHRPTLNLLRVERFEPGHGSLEANARPQLTWKFNLPIADRRADVPPVTIKPALAGKFSWDDERTLRFVPTEPLPVASQWEFVVAREGLKSVEGCTLADDLRQVCQTAALTLVSAQQSGFDDETVSLELKFNDLVLPADLASRLTVLNDAGRAMPVTVREGKPSATLTAVVAGIDPSARGRQLTVSIRKGLSAHTGKLGLASDVSRPVPITTELVLNRAEAVSSDESCVINLRFNGQVDADKLTEVLSIEPKVAGFRYEQNGDSYVSLRGPFQPATRYALKFAAPPGNVSRADYPRPETRTVFVPDVRAQLGFESEEGYLGAAGRRTVYAWAVNIPTVELEIYRLYDSNLVPWGTAGDDVSDQGRLVVSRTMRLQNRKNVREEIRLALDELLPTEHRGDGIFQVRLHRTPVARDRRDADVDAERDYHGPPTASMQLALSDIGLAVKHGEGQIVACALSLATAKPLAETRIRVFSSKNQLIGEGTTGADGTADITLAKLPDGESPAIVVADRKLDERRRSTTWLRLSGNTLNLSAFDTTGRPYLRKGFEAFVYNERGVYRPGETVRFRAIVRGPNGVKPPEFPVQWVLIDPRGKNYEGGTSMINADGGTHWDWATADGTLTGPWRVQVRLANHDRGVPDFTFGGTQIQLEDFMPDRLKVELKLGDDARPRVSPDAVLPADLKAAYFFGQAGAGLKADVSATAYPTVFHADAWRGWSFSDEGDVTGTAVLAGMRRQMPKVQATLDGQGALRLPIELKTLLAADAGKPVYRGAWRISVEAAVHDISGRAITRYAEAMVDAPEGYLGLRTTAHSAAPALPTAFDVVRLDHRGQVRAGGDTVHVALHRVTWNNVMTQRGGRYVFESTRVLKEVESKRPAALSAGRASFPVTPPTAGQYIVSVTDPVSGIVTSTRLEVIGRDWTDTISRENPERLEVSVLPQNLATVSQWIDRGESRAWLRPITSFGRQWLATQKPAAHLYQAGEWASVVVKSPFAGTLLLTVETDRVIERRAIEMTHSAVTVPVQIDDRCRPNVYVSASVVRAVDPNVAWRTHRAYGLAAVSVAQTERKLSLDVAAAAEIKPGHTLPVRLQVKDAAGRPVAGAAVTVAGVDEGILQLTGFTTPDPYRFFSAKRALAVASSDLYGSLVPDGLRTSKTGDVGGDEDFPASRYKPPVGARRVKPVALSAEVRTDADGFAQADLQLPQFSGQLRLMAVAHAGPASGAGQGMTIVRSAVVVQTSWPRFAAPGDRFDVPVTLFNTTGTDAAASIRLRLEGPLQSDAADPAGLTVPAGGQLTHVFRVSAAQSVGVGRAIVTATLNGESATDDVELPVRPAAPMMTFGGAQTAMPGQPLEIEPARPLLGGIGQYRLRVSSRPELILPQGLDYLNSYPYGCCEQTVSGLFPLISLRDLAEQIDPVLFQPEAIADKVRAGMARLVLMQRADGSLSMWPEGSGGWSHASIYAAHFLAMAEQAGYKVPPGFRDRLYGYVRSVLNRSVDEPDALENQAYACYVLAIAGRLDSADRVALERLTQLATRPPVSSELTPHAPTRFLLSAAWLAIQHRSRAEGLVPEVFPRLRTTRQLSGNIGSPVSDRAMILSTLLTVQPEHPSVAPMVEELVQLGRRGEWRSTKDVSLSLLALAQYQRKFKDVQPFMSAELRHGVERLARAEGGKELLWRSPNTLAALPATQPTTQPGLSVVIDGPAESRGYASWVQTGVPLTPPADETGKGLVIHRRLLTPDGSEAIGNGRLLSGQLVRVELTVEASRNFDCVAIEDLLPAGLEIENPRLASSSQLTEQRRPATADPAQVRELRLDASPDIRDDRIVLFTSLQAGVAKYEYLARAITPGTFTVPPVRAECMYDLATFSLTGSGSITVVAEQPAAVVAGEAAGR